MHKTIHPNDPRLRYGGRRSQVALDMLGPAKGFKDPTEDPPAGETILEYSSTFPGPPVRRAMKPIYLVACGASKARKASPAKDLYTGTLFRRSRELAELKGEAWFILSAEHGLVHPDQVLEPYNATLSDMTTAAQNIWAQEVVADLRERLGIPVAGPKSIDFVLLAGISYRFPLLKPLSIIARSVTAPLVGLGIGRQIKELNSRIREAKA